MRSFRSRSSWLLVAALTLISLAPALAHALPALTLQPVSVALERSDPLPAYETIALPAAHVALYAISAISHTEVAPAAVRASDGILARSVRHQTIAQLRLGGPLRHRHVNAYVQSCVGGRMGPDNRPQSPPRVAG